MAIEEDLKDCREVSFQAALLYTSSKVRTADLVTARDLHPDLRYDEQGERRIRVHTLCVPTTASLQEVIQSADQQCIVGLLAKMAVDRTLNTNLADAREAFINVCVDTIERWAGLSIQFVCLRHHARVQVEDAAVYQPAGGAAVLNSA